MSRALIIIDFINEFIHPDGLITPQGMGVFCEMYGTIGHARELIDAFRSSGEEVIWVHLGFHENYDNCSTRSPRFRSVPSTGILREDTWSTEFVAELSYDVREKTIIKTRVSAFYNTDLESYLREQGIDEIVVAGVATDLAVSSITRDAHDRDILVTVAHDACGTISQEHHDAALIAIAKLASVHDTADIIHNS